MTRSIPEYQEEITLASFKRWINAARPGEKLVYHHGYLAMDRETVSNIPSLGGFIHVFIEPAHSIGSLAWIGYERGMVLLYQRKGPDGLFDYVAEKRATKRRLPE